MFNEICINEETLPKYTYIYINIYISQDLALNNLQGLICHKN